ncbi:hypothetical protein Vafri_15701 [Volvox africanus]|uniref:Rhamnosyl O-methyltransferase n=1 Tax=Volvox africanus TaxID=51714 RepID=A0A8J4F5R9_9CHLO|nr:hypothetical protein Vafri_15701 [Volvox africanus]
MSYGWTTSCTDMTTSSKKSTCFLLGRGSACNLSRGLLTTSGSRDALCRQRCRRRCLCRCATPSIQDPWDLVAIQQLVWDVKPKVIYDIGTNVGGSAILFAHIMSQYAKPGEALIVSVDPKDFTVNWDAEAQRLCPRCTAVKDNPLWGQYVRFVKARAVERSALAALQKAISTFGGPVLISLDGWHRYAEVLKQCHVLSQYVTIGSYIIVQDTKLDRFLSKAGPRRAVHDFLKNNTDFEIDKSREAFLYSQHTDGYLRRIK